MLGRPARGEGERPGPFAFPVALASAEDGALAPIAPLAEGEAALAADPERAALLANAALRAGFECAGVMFARLSPPPPLPPASAFWRRVAEHGLAPDHAPLTLAVRALSPRRGEGREHARYFQADIARLRPCLFGRPAFVELDWYPLRAALALALTPAARAILKRLADAADAKPSAAPPAPRPALIAHHAGRALVRELAR